MFSGVFSLDELPQPEAATVRKKVQTAYKSIEKKDFFGRSL